MFWTGLGCLLQFVNSIVWNKNMTNRAPAYCDICMSFNAFSSFHSLRHATATRIQVALNVALPASSLCINRQLYRVAWMKTAAVTDSEKLRNMIYDLLVGVGIPVLQMIVGECAHPFAANPLYSRAQSRVLCFSISLQHIRGFRPLSLRVVYAASLCSRFCMAHSYWCYISLLWW